MNTHGHTIYTIPPCSLVERVLGVTNPDDHHASLSQAHHTLTGEHVDAETLITLAGTLQETLERAKNDESDPGIHKADVELVESSIALNALVYTLVKREKGYMTYLRAWPLFESLHSPQPDTALTIGRKALLIGSLSALSSAAFVAFSEDRLRAEPIVIDPRTSVAKRRYGTFVQGSGLAMPSEWSNTMDAVQTNILLPMLIDGAGHPVKGEQPELVGMRRLLGEIFRVTKPGGELAMFERPPRYDLQDLPYERTDNQTLIASFTDTLHDELNLAGFTDVRVAKGWEPETNDYLFDPTRRFHKYPKLELPYMRTAQARKPA